VTLPNPMSINSAIEWTESTWNPLTGCTKISEGCRHCYAETNVAHPEARLIKHLVVFSMVSNPKP
jgi:protein gp37